MNHDLNLYCMPCTHFRAMFVSNCSVDINRVLRSPSGGYEKKSSKIKKATTTGEGSNSNLHTEAAAPPEETDSFHPVACASCGTEVCLTAVGTTVHGLTCIPDMTTALKLKYFRHLSKQQSEACVSCYIM